MRILRHVKIAEDLDHLKRKSKFITPSESLEAWEKLFCVKGLTETPGIDRCGGYGSHQIYKARVVAVEEKGGKSQGYRVIFKIAGDDCIIIFFSRHGVYKKEQELIDIVRTRLANLTTC